MRIDRNGFTHAEAFLSRADALEWERMVLERTDGTNPRNPTAVPPLLVRDRQGERPKMPDSHDDEATHSAALILDRELFDRSIWWDSLKEMQLDLRMFADDWLAKLDKALTEHPDECPLENMKRFAIEYRDGAARLAAVLLAHAKT